MSRERGLVSLMYSIFFCVENLLIINSRWIETGRRRRHRDRQAELETSEEMVMKISIILSKYCIVNIPTLLTQLLYATSYVAIMASEFLRLMSMLEILIE